MAKKNCKCKATECEECPEWIFTFADLVMLMMGFFVILWVLKPAPDPKKDEGKGKSSVAEEQPWLETVGEIRGAFGWEPNPASKDPVDQATIRRRERLGEGQGGRTDRKPHGADGAHQEVESIRKGKQVVIGGRIAFAAGSTVLDAAGKRTLDQVAKLIQGHEQLFIVKGHASLDDLPPAGKTDAKSVADFRMNLSMQRAEVVTQYLVAAGVEARVLRIQGCSTFEPVAKQAYTEDRNAQNRRAEVESSDNTIADVQEGARVTNVLPPGVGTESATSSDHEDHR